MRRVAGFGLLAVATGLDNGQGLTPPMGYSSWNDCASNVTEDRMKTITRALIRTGLAAKGYIHINVDEGWLEGRNASGYMMESPERFPSGMKNLGEWVHSQVVPGKGAVFKYGLYTSRGTCQCGTQQYSAPGTHGHVAEDAAWMLEAGMDYLKEDSCCGSQDHQEAFTDYASMRDALNTSGRPVYFSLCGWHNWYAPVGDSLGNSWRIQGDGQNWGALTECMNTNAYLTQYARPGAWNDPDLLQGTGYGSSDLATNPKGCFDIAAIPQAKQWYQTETQARTQFSVWAIMSAPLLISANIDVASDFLLETWGNEEVIAINQELAAGGPYQGERIVGSNITFDSAKQDGSGTNVWGKRLTKGEFALVFVNNGPSAANVTCGSECFDKLLSGWSSASSLKPRDLWAKKDMDIIAAPFDFTAEVGSLGDQRTFRFFPAN